VNIEQQGCGVRQFEVEQGPRAAAIELAVSLARVDVGLITLTLLGRSSRKPRVDRIGERAADRSRDVGRLPPAVVEIDIALEMVGGPCLEMMLIAPPAVFFPYNVPCGPSNISTRSTSYIAAVRNPGKLANTSSR
jgi:hypothetical protein